MGEEPESCTFYSENIIPEVSPGLLGFMKIEVVVYKNYVPLV